ncbi:MAG TPA: DUF3048 domain-containing protein [Acidimicrobiia bacterium]|nr:DUF3048 domain-containing protein [Acidimicrobiia bacterium]
MIRRLIVALLLLAIVAACGGDAAPTTTTTVPTTTSTTTAIPTTTTTTTLPPTTTTIGPETTVTTFPADFASPLNGLPAQDTLALDRSVIAIKIDNHPEARPQSGLLEADAVIELLVEGGFTRFIALFHDNESDFVGPIRSLRPTDSTLVLPTGAPLFMSGGQQWVQSLTVARGQRILGESAGMFRSSLRVAPHNLYGRTETLRDRADARGYTDRPASPLLPIDDWPYPDDTASEVELRWSDINVVVWRYFPDKRTYGRWTNNSRHYVQDEDREQTQIEVEVLVILEGDLYTAFPPADGTPVPATDTVGTGEAWVLARGRVWHGTWHRSDIDEPFELRSDDGSTASVPAGLAWISVFPAGSSMTVSE